MTIGGEQGSWSHGEEREEDEDDGSMEEEEEEEEEDPIIKRIPLFFNSAPDFTLPSFAHFKPVLADETSHSNLSDSRSEPLANKIKRPKALTLLQYPFKTQNPSTSHPLLPPSLRPEHPSNPQQPQQQHQHLLAQIHAKYKPGVRSLKLDLPLETKIGIQENRFSDERAREFARGVQENKNSLSQSIGFNKKHHNPLNDDECDPLDTISLGSTLIPEQANYAVGILRRTSSRNDDDDEDVEDEGHRGEGRDELHIVPLDQTLQMRPSLDYLDYLDTINAQADKLARQEQGLDSDSEDRSDAEEVDEEAVKKKILAKKKAEANEAKAIQVSVVSNSADGDRMGAGLRSGGPLLAPRRAAEAETPITLIHYHPETKECEAIRQKLYSPKQHELHSISSWTELLKV